MTTKEILISLLLTIPLAAHGAGDETTSTANTSSPTAKDPQLIIEHEDAVPTDGPPEGGDSMRDGSEESPASFASFFTIRSSMNNKCLEIYAFNNNNGARSGMWDCWGGANQKWYWNGEEIRNSMNNKCLEVLSFNNNNGATVGMWDCWGGANQKWYRDGNQIRSRFNNKCLEIYALSNDNGARGAVWDCWGGANQQWYFGP